MFLIKSRQNTFKNALTCQIVKNFSRPPFAKAAPSCYVNVISAIPLCFLFAVVLSYGKIGFSKFKEDVNAYL